MFTCLEDPVVLEIARKAARCVSQDPAKWDDFTSIAALAICEAVNKIEAAVNPAGLAFHIGRQEVLKERSERQRRLKRGAGTIPTSLDDQTVSLPLGEIRSDPQRTVPTRLDLAAFFATAGPDVMIAAGRRAGILPSAACDREALRDRMRLLRAAKKYGHMLQVKVAA